MGNILRTCGETTTSAGRRIVFPPDVGAPATRPVSAPTEAGRFHWQDSGNRRGLVRVDRVVQALCATTAQRLAPPQALQHPARSPRSPGSGLFQFSLALSRRCCFRV